MNFTIIFFNILWMMFNLSLAVVAFVLGWLMIKVKRPILRILCAVWWLVFVPNTIYILTDVYSLTKQIPLVENTVEVVLFIQYMLLFFLGAFLFILSFYPYEKMLAETLSMGKFHLYTLLIATNFVIAIGVVMGRVHRTNSWEVITDPVKVVQDIIAILSSIHLIALVLIFGTFANLFYFLLRNYIVSKAYQLYKKLEIR